MATAAARSPSPCPARPWCTAMRRSADSSPFKLADCRQRSSSVSKSGGGGGGGCGGHASPRRSFGEKENEQRDAAAAARTPKAARSGGAKNFMAPTFSAASKAVAASTSPRKKVLGERNEQYHLAPSSRGDLALEPKGPPPEAGASPTRRLHLSFDGVPAAAPEAPHGSRHSFAGDDARTEKPGCKDHHHAAVDSVDAEPSQAAAVYDPKTNYLSPRPRFLHYKPNPRIEMYRHGGSGVRRLDEGFASESSDDELTEEEQEQEQQKSKPNDLLEEPFALAAPSEAGVEVAVPVEDRVLLPEPAPASPGALVLTSEPAAKSPRGRVLTPEPRAASPRAPAKKSSSLRFLLAAPLALILFMAAAFVCVPLPPDAPLMSNAALWKVPDFLSVQELHPVELAAWLKQWSSSSLDSITSYWEALVFAREQEFFGPRFGANLSAAPADADHGADFYNFAETWPMPSKESIGASMLEFFQDIVSESNTDLTAQPEAGVVVEEESIDDAAVEEESIDAAAADHFKVVEELVVEMSEEAPGSNGESFNQDLDIPSQPTGEPEQRDNLEDSESSLQQDVESDEYSESSLQQDVESDESKGDHTDGKEAQEAYHGLKLDSSMWPGYLGKISKPAAVVIALAIVILSTAMVFLHIRQKQAPVATNANAPAEEAEQAETQSGSGSREGHLLVKGSQFQSSVAEETERFGGSEVSQYSSSLSSGHGRRRKTKEEESPSLEPMSKTESTSSYGSFTTYEKISAKKRNKEDEAMTPVRRSSRLRNVKSPEA